MHSGLVLRLLAVTVELSGCFYDPIDEDAS